MESLSITRIASGGLITNYFCSSRCAHCLYGCGPEWAKDYIDEEATERILTKVLKLGCSSVHIGGGEPLLRPEALIKVLRAARRIGMKVEYLETNSSWFKGMDEAVEMLGTLRSAGVETLLISISPFHNEHIPLRKVKGVAAACREVGMGVFPWMSEFLGEIASFDESDTHFLDEYVKEFGDDYLSGLVQRYSLTLRGRAVKTYEKILPGRRLEEILAAGAGGCRELAGTHHFHVDLYGGYIPGLCSGLSIRGEDLGAPLDPDKYKLLDLLWRKGISGLLELARKEFGFSPQGKYLSKCSLCLDIRSWLNTQAPGRFIELQPVDFYRHV